MSTETGFQARTGKDIHMGNDNKILATVITVMLILSALVGIVARLQGLSTTFFRRYKYFFECLLILSLNKAHYSQKKMQEFLRRTITVVQVALNYGRKLRRVITINSNPLSKIIFEFINNIRYNKPISLSLIVL